MESQPSIRSGRLTVVPGVSGMMSYITCFFHFFLRISWIFAVKIAICNPHYLHIDLQWPKWIIDVWSIAEPQSALWSLAAVHLQIQEATTTLQFLLEAFPCRWVFLLGRSLEALKARPMRKAGFMRGAVKEWRWDTRKLPGWDMKRVHADITDGKIGKCWLMQHTF